MKIIRDGKEYELTESELSAAYYEMQHEIDKEDVENEMEQYPGGLEFGSEEEREKFIDEVIVSLRDFLSSGEHYWEIYYAALDTVLEECILKFGGERE